MKSEYTGYAKASDGTIWLSDNPNDLEEYPGRVFPLHLTSLENLGDLSSHLSKGWELVDLRRKNTNA